MNQESQGDYIQKIAENIETIIELDGEVSEEASLQIVEDLWGKLTPEEKKVLFIKYIEDKNMEYLPLILDISEEAFTNKLKTINTKAIEVYISFLESNT